MCSGSVAMTDLLAQFALEEEEVTTSVTVASGNANTSPVAGYIDIKKCSWCQACTDKHESVLGMGLDTFKKHCAATCRYDLMEYVTSYPNNTHLLHRSCK